MPGGSVDGEALLTQQILRGLGDKLYDKRKLAALEVEQLVKNLAREVRPPSCHTCLPGAALHEAHSTRPALCMACVRCKQQQY